MCLNFGQVKRQRTFDRQRTKGSGKTEQCETGRGEKESLREGEKGREKGGEREESYSSCLRAG